MDSLAAEGESCVFSLMTLIRSLFGSIPLSAIACGIRRTPNTKPFTTPRTAIKMNDKIKVSKNGITKEIQKKDLPEYVAMGWNEVSTNTIQPKKIERIY